MPWSRGKVCSVLEISFLGGCLVSPLLIVLYEALVQWHIVLGQGYYREKRRKNIYLMSGLAEGASVVLFSGKRLGGLLPRRPDRLPQHWGQAGRPRAEGNTGPGLERPVISGVHGVNSAQEQYFMPVGQGTHSHAQSWGNTNANWIKKRQSFQQRFLSLAKLGRRSQCLYEICHTFPSRKLFFYSIVFPMYSHSKFILGSHLCISSLERLRISPAGLLRPL